MNVYHKYELIDNKLTCVIYVDYPANYEFGLDFNAMKQKVINLSAKVREYALSINNKISDDKALLVLNGIVAGTLIISNLNSSTILASNTTNNLQNNTEIVQKVKKNEDNTSIQSTLTSNLDTKSSYDILKQEELQKKQEQEQKIATSTIKESQKTNTKIITSTQTNSNTKKTTSNKTSSTSNKKQNTSSNKNTSNNQTTSNKNNTTTSNTNNSTSINSDQKVKLKLNNGSVISIDLEEYVIGVVGAEMPASFSTEALKAQAVAARTYAMKKVSSSQTLTATTSTQCYKTNNELKSYWGNSYSTYYSKVKNAVTATKGQVIKCNGKYIDALYFSMSNGRTEDAANVWGNSFSYLKSVDSPYDANLKSATYTKTIDKSVVSSKLGVTINSLSQINIKSKTVGNRVNVVTIDGKDFTGVQIRTKLGLRSADFTVTESGNNFIFTTKGFGHGVGMSQYGANEMGKKGYSYKQILTHYYTGVKVVKI